MPKSSPLVITAPTAPVDSATTTIDLPPRYYQDNFSQLLQFTRQRYGDLLTEQELGFIEDFNQMSIDAQCIYVRLLLRRGDWFRIEKLNYPEINQLDQALEEAQNARFIERVTESDHLLNDVAEWLSCFTKQECWAAFPNLPIAKNSRRPELDVAIIDYLQQHPDQLSNLTHDNLVCVYGSQEMSVLTLLYFGNAYQDLTEFVLRDLGIYQYYQYPLGTSTRWCQSRQQLQAHQQLAELCASYPPLADCDKELLQEWQQKLAPYRDYPSLRRRVDKLTVSIARQLERLGEISPALELYEQCQRMPARERRCRILVKQQQFDPLLDWLNQLTVDDCHPEEQQFFRQFILRQKSLRPYHSQLPEWLLQQASPPAVVNWTLSSEVMTQTSSLERRCLTDLVENPGSQSTGALLIPAPATGYFCENVLIPSIFGLYFWEVIFADIEGAFCHPFQTRPRDLYESDFAERRQQLIEQKLAELSLDRLLAHCADQYQRQYGLANDWVIWPALSWPMIELACQRIPLAHWRIFFQCLFEDCRHRRSGWPDLILFSEDGYQLLEVKGPGDQLQKNQRAWFELFDRHQIPAQVLKVSYPQTSDEE